MKCSYPSSPFYCPAVGGFFFYYYFFFYDVQSVLRGIIREYFSACLFEMVPDQLFVVIFKQIKLRESRVPE